MFDFDEEFFVEFYELLGDVIDCLYLVDVNGVMDLVIWVCNDDVER